MVGVSDRILQRMEDTRRKKHSGDGGDAHGVGAHL